MIKFVPKIQKKDKRTDLEKELDNAILLLRTETPGTDGYNAQLEVVEKLTALVKDSKSSNPKIDLNTVVTCGTSLLSVLSILNFEKTGVLASKAMNFVMKGRIK